MQGKAQPPAALCLTEVPQLVEKSPLTPPHSTPEILILSSSDRILLKFSMAERREARQIYMQELQKLGCGLFVFAVCCHNLKTTHGAEVLDHY